MLETQVFNPITGRRITRNGRTAKKLIKQHGGDFSCPEGFVKHKVTEYGDDCAVCMERLEPGNLVKLFPCCHVMHFDCALDWIADRGTCPICRSAVSDDWWYDEDGEWIPSSS